MDIYTEQRKKYNKARLKRSRLSKYFCKFANLSIKETNLSNGKLS